MLTRTTRIALAALLTGALLAGATTSAQARTISGTMKADTLNGTTKGDLIIGLNGNDSLKGKAGRDRLRGGKGRDKLLGGAGRDRVWGGKGRDRLLGGADPDRIYGGADNDVIFGGKGADRLYGGPGNDTFHGGLGSDRMFGGPGKDRFLLRDKRRDTITCGPGVDTVIADQFDRVSADCENVLRPKGVGSTPPGLPPAPPGQPQSAAVQVVSAAFDDPLLVTQRPGDARLYVVEQGGRVQIVAGTSIAPTPFLDVSSLISRGNEQGLLGLAFHPQHAQNGLFYVNYTDTAGTTQIVEYSARGAATADPASARTVLSIPQFEANHNGGNLAFGPDGMLYIGTGDGGGGGDPQRHGQNPNTLLGAMLRIDVNTRDAGQYGIPAGNPFVGRTDARPEVWAIGLRNPWRYSFDRTNGNLWIADVGQNAVEEVNRVTAAEGTGANFGWNAFEGTQPFPGGQPLGEGTYRAPVAEYTHSGGNCSVTGGHVYRGAAVPVLAGRYLYGDFCTGQIWSVAADGAAGAPVNITTLLGGPHMFIKSFGEDAAGEMYMAVGNTVYRIVAA